MILLPVQCRMARAALAGGFENLLQQPRYQLTPSLGLNVETN